MQNNNKIICVSEKKYNIDNNISDKVYTNCIKILDLIHNEPENIVPTDRNSVKFIYEVKDAQFIIDIYESSFYLLKIIKNDYSTAVFKNIEDINIEDVLREYKDFIKSGFIRKLEE